MDPTVPVEKHSAVVQEQHASQPRAVQPLHGTQNSLDRSAMHLQRRLRPKAPGYCMSIKYPAKRCVYLIMCRLGPTMCNHRHPLGGRNFESFSEDPLLTGKLAAQYVVGLQEKGVAGTCKHFAANEQETDRLTVNEIISERALREIYLKPFEIAVKEANPWAFMTAYNQINGTHADSNKFTLEKVLRGEWGWNGLVMSDWGGTNSTAEALEAGLDLEMPGPARHRTYKGVKEAIKNGDLTEEAITNRARNVLELIRKVGGFKNPEIPPEQSVDKPEHRKLVRDVAGQGLVLLKNDNGVLPLRKDKVKGKKIAMLGLAKEALIHGGGSASLNAHYMISPWDGMHNTYGDDVEFKFAKGMWSMDVWELQCLTNARCPHISSFAPTSRRLDS